MATAVAIAVVRFEAIEVAGQAIDCHGRRHDRAFAWCGYNCCILGLARRNHNMNLGVVAIAGSGDHETRCVR